MSVSQIGPKVSMIFNIFSKPAAGRTSAYVASALFLFFLPFIAGLAGNSWVRIIDFALLYIILALGLNIVVGFAGLLDLGYIAFYALGAYLMALCASPHLPAFFDFFARFFPNGMHISFWIVLPIGALLAAGFGMVLGAPTLRLKGDYLAIVTLGFGEIIRIFMNNLDRPWNITNGPKGLAKIDPVLVAGVPFNKDWTLLGIVFHPTYLYYYLFLVVAVCVVIISYRLHGSRIGRAWMAIRDDELAAKAMGINVRNMKLLAFSIGASFGGLAGVLFASFQGFVSPESFGLMESIAILAMVVLGGLGHVPGVILGGIIVSGLPELLRYTVTPIQKALFGQVYIEAEVLRMLAYGLAMILIMIYRPAGLWSAPSRVHN